MARKYFDLSEIEKQTHDYEEDGDPPGSGENSEVYARAMLAELDGPRGGCVVTESLPSDAEHVVNCFNDALAGILHGLSVRVAPGQMKKVCHHLVEHARFTMAWVAEIEDRNDDSEKAENEQDLLG